MKICDIYEATHVRDQRKKVHRIVSKWGIDGRKLQPPSNGGFGCVVENGECISMFDATAYYLEDLNTEAPEEVREMEMYAWVGRDEYGSGVFGLKQGLVPAGLIPMVAIDQKKLDQYWKAAEAQARDSGERIYLVRLKVTEVVRATKDGK